MVVMSIAALALHVKVPARDWLCAAAVDMLMLSAVRLIAAVTTSERVAASRIAMPSKPTLSDNLIGDAFASKSSETSKLHRRIQWNLDQIELDQGPTRPQNVARRRQRKAAA